MAPLTVVPTVATTAKHFFPSDFIFSLDVIESLPLLYRLSQSTITGNVNVNTTNTSKTKIEQIEKVQKQESSDTPSLDQNENISKISRKEALNENERISFENENIIGSISLVGATIDDLTFKKYNTKLNSNEKIVLLNPKKVENGYSIESGFVTNNKNIDTPNAASLWKVEGNKKLQKYLG